jgi:hypothetical protein
MPITRNLSRSGTLHRGHRRRRAAMASAALVAVTLLTTACGNGDVRVKHIHHASSHGASQSPQAHAS